MKRTWLPWILVGLAQVGFLAWYDYSGGPLSAEEIETYAARLAAQGLPGTDVARGLRTFAEGDDGREFLMVNLENRRPEPVLPPGVEQGADPADVEARYSAPTALRLLARACHPLGSLRGRVNFIDYPGAPTWERLLLVRYRTRRDFLEIFTAPETAEAIRFKFVFLEQGHSWPTRSGFWVPGLRAQATLALLLLGGVGHAAIRLRAHPKRSVSS